MATFLSMWFQYLMGNKRKAVGSVPVHNSKKTKVIRNKLFTATEENTLTKFQRSTIDTLLNNLQQQFSLENLQSYLAYFTKSKNGESNVKSKYLALKVLEQLSKNLADAPEKKCREIPVVGEDGISFLGAFIIETLSLENIYSLSKAAVESNQGKLDKRQRTEFLNKALLLWNKYHVNITDIVAIAKKKYSLQRIQMWVHHLMTVKAEHRLTAKEQSHVFSHCSWKIRAQQLELFLQCPASMQVWGIKLVSKCIQRRRDFSILDLFRAYAIELTKLSVPNTELYLPRALALLDKPFAGKNLPDAVAYHPVYQNYRSYLFMKVLTQVDTPEALFEFAKFAYGAWYPLVAFAGKMHHPNDLADLLPRDSDLLAASLERIRGLFNAGLLEVSASVSSSMFTAVVFTPDEQLTEQPWVLRFLIEYDLNQNPQRAAYSYKSAAIKRMLENKDFPWQSLKNLISSLPQEADFSPMPLMDYLLNKICHLSQIETEQLLARVLFLTTQLMRQHNSYSEKRAGIYRQLSCPSNQYYPRLMPAVNAISKYEHLFNSLPRRNSSEPLSLLEFDSNTLSYRKLSAITRLLNSLEQKQLLDEGVFEELMALSQVRQAKFASKIFWLASVIEGEGDTERSLAITKIINTLNFILSPRFDLVYQSFYEAILPLTKEHKRINDYLRLINNYQLYLSRLNICAPRYVNECINYIKTSADMNVDLISPMISNPELTHQTVASMLAYTRAESSVPDAAVYSMPRLSF